ncbi:hypothetical protein [Kibdelosporangium philippinense]|uniref:hypothetical protein n=1 Tax=Kibdelosporangium philippinense TaxID=211113 RepID=UPI0036216CAF
MRQRPGHHRRRLEVFQQLHLLGQHPGQNPPGNSQQLREQRTGQRVVDVRALLAGGHQPGPAQHRQLL